ncbi:hypothetical protein WAI453_008989 [Rhynchosporium graminicola]
MSDVTTDLSELIEALDAEDIFKIAAHDALRLVPHLDFALRRINNPFSKAQTEESENSLQFFPTVRGQVFLEALMPPMNEDGTYTLPGGRDVFNFLLKRAIPGRLQTVFSEANFASPFKETMWSMHSTRRTFVSSASVNYVMQLMRSLLKKRQVSRVESNDSGALFSSGTETNSKYTTSTY